MKLSLKLALFVCLAAQLARAQGTITTIAGKPFVFPSGDVPALRAPLGQITGVAVDPAGNVLAADVDNDFIVRITPAGILSVISRLDDPTFLAVDTNGTIWVRSVTRMRRVRADGGFDEILMRSLAGPIRHFILGTAPNSFAVGTQNDLYFTDPGNAQVVKFTPDADGQWTGQILAGDGQCRFAGDGGAAPAASLCEPRAVALDRTGAIYVADSGNSRIRRIGPDGIIRTIAGNGQRAVSGDGGPALQASVGFIPAMAADAAGNLFFIDCGAVDCTRSTLRSNAQQRVRRIDTRGIITTIAGGADFGFAGDGGPAAAARLHDPRALAFDAAGNLFIADMSNRRVRRVSGGVIQTIAGDGLYKSRGDGGPARDASLNAPAGLALDPVNQIFVAELGSHRVRRIDAQGIITNFAGSSALGYRGDGGPATAAFLDEPRQIALDPAGNLYIVERGNNVLRRVRRDGIIETVGPDLLSGNSDIAIDSAGTIYLAQTQGVFTVNPVTGATTPFLPAPGFTGFITAVATDGARNVYVGTANPMPRSCTGQVYRIDRSGTRRDMYSGNCVVDLATDHQGNLFVAEGAAVIRVNADGTAARAAGRAPECPADIPDVDGGPATCARITVGAIGADTAGNLLIVDSERGLIRQVTPCRFSLPQAAVSVSAIAGTGGAAVNTTAGCAWQARSNVGWIAVTSPPGYGSGTVYLSFARNAAAAARSGTVSIAGQTLTVTQAAITAETAQPAEPRITRALPPGFYIAEATLNEGAGGGFWGMEILASRGQTAGGLNFGGAMAGEGSRLGFGAFLLPTDQTITATINIFAPTDTQIALRVLNAQRQEVARLIPGSPRLSQALPAGFYIIEVTHTADVPVNFLLGVEAPGFSGGMDVGGYIGPGITGFGAFYVPEEQEVTIRLLGRSSYGAAGAGAMTLTLRDAGRNVVAVAAAP